jgi:hypothetical protein
MNRSQSCANWTKWTKAGTPTAFVHFAHIAHGQHQKTITTRQAAPEPIGRWMLLIQHSGGSLEEVGDIVKRVCADPIGTLRRSRAYLFEKMATRSHHDTRSGAPGRPALVWVIDMKHRISGKDATYVAMEAAKRGPIRVEPSPDHDSRRAIGSQDRRAPQASTA